MARREQLVEQVSEPSLEHLDLGLHAAVATQAI
jgi:hypothetical protein